MRIKHLQQLEILAPEVFRRPCNHLRRLPCCFVSLISLCAFSFTPSSLGSNNRTLHTEHTSLRQIVHCPIPENWPVPKNFQPREPHFAYGPGRLHTATVLSRVFFMQRKALDLPPCPLFGTQSGSRVLGHYFFGTNPKRSRFHADMVPLKPYFNNHPFPPLMH